MKRIFGAKKGMAAAAVALSAVLMAGCTISALPDGEKAAGKLNGYLSGTNVGTGQNETAKNSTGTTGTENGDENAGGTADTQTSEPTTAAARKIQSIEITDDILAADTTSYDTGASTEDLDSSNVPNGYRYYMTRWGSDYNASWLADTSSNVIYLTFDCLNSDAGSTSDIVDALASVNVKGTFFVTQDFVDGNPDLVKRILDEGHALGNGSVSYPTGGEPALTPEEMVNDIMPLEDKVYDEYNYEMPYFRFPSGTFSDQTLLIAQKMGFRSIFWSFSSMDTAASSDEVLSSMQERMHPGEIMRLSGSSDGVAGALGDFVNYAHGQGFTFAQFDSDERY